MSKTLFKMNYWYAARDNEIFLDLDSNRAVARALSVLRLAIRKRHLSVRAVWLYSTPTQGHAHMIVVLRRKFMPHETRIAWSLWLGNDRLRAAYVLQRHMLQRHISYFGCSCVTAPDSCSLDLLITSQKYYREQDDMCFCKRKHKAKKVTDACEAMERLLGDQRSADYFTRTGKAPPRRKIRVPWGKVSLEQIKNWSPVYEREHERLLQDNGNVGSVQKLAKRNVEAGSSVTCSD